MIRIVCLLLLCAAVKAQRNDCLTFCTCEVGIATCRNVPAFPQFITTRWLETLILIDGTLTTLPISQDRFPRLRQLALRNCRFISCSVVHDLRASWTELLLDSNTCADTTTEVTVSTDIYLSTTTSTSDAATGIATQQSISTYSVDTVITTITIPNGEGTPNVEPLSEPEDESNDLAVILGASITSVVVIVGVVVIFVAYCAYKKCRNRVRQFTADDDEFFGLRTRSIVNPSYEQHSAC